MVQFRIFPLMIVTMSS